MTFQERLRDLVTGWETTLRKRSVQITTLNIAWQTVVTSAPDLFPPFWANCVTLGLTGLALAASNLTQTTVATYDPTKYRLVPLGGDDAGKQ